MKRLRMSPLGHRTIVFLLVTSVATSTLAQEGSEPENSDHGKYAESIKFVTAIGKALGSAAGGKAASTAVDFALKLLELTGPSEVDLAKKEIISAIHAEQADRLIGLIDGAMTSFHTVLSDPANMHSPGLLVEVISKTDNAVGEIRNIINTGNTDVSYQIAPALTVATSINAAALKLAEFPTSRIIDMYQTMMNLGMDLVGVDFIYVRNKAVKETSDSKLLWQKANLGGHVYQPRCTGRAYEPGHRGTMREMSAEATILAGRMRRQDPKVHALDTPFFILSLGCFPLAGAQLLGRDACVGDPRVQQ
jgi:hypothetical protein